MGGFFGRGLGAFCLGLAVLRDTIAGMEELGDIFALKHGLHVVYCDCISGEGYQAMAFRNMCTWI